MTMPTKENYTADELLLVAHSLLECAFWAAEDDEGCGAGIRTTIAVAQDKIAAARALVAPRNTDPQPEAVE